MSLKLLSCIMFVKSKLSVDSELGYHRDLKKVGWHFFSNPIWLPKQRWPPCKNAEYIVYCVPKRKPPNFWQ